MIEFKLDVYKFNIFNIFNTLFLSLSHTHAHTHVLAIVPVSLDAVPGTGPGRWPTALPIRPKRQIQYFYPRHILNENIIFYTFITSCGCSYKEIKEPVLFLMKKE